MLVRLECILLMVGGELERDVDEGQRGESVVSDCQRRAGLTHGGEGGGYGEHKQEDILDASCEEDQGTSMGEDDTVRTYEDEIHDLE